MMQNTKMIEPFTAHYVFALGIARLLGSAHWIISVYETAGTYLYFSWKMILFAINGVALGNCSNFHIGRLLLLLYQKCHEWPASTRSASCLNLWLWLLWVYVTMYNWLTDFDHEFKQVVVLMLLFNQKCSFLLALVLPSVICLSFLMLRGKGTILVKW